jgi:hypothetical protein
LSVVNGFEVERLLEYLAFVLKIRLLARVWDSQVFGVVYPSVASH